ncbi:S9 family peptidase [Arthrobacter sp. H41]|uniref:S9 family peptidase n=1 Tax=Arthrobacter sp. H41 TaxID=1312978 RepID=UPI0020A6A465|nr:S9 family peptidase [Arthrobacter sp. H41]
MSPPSLHPSGLTAVAAVTRPDFDADSYVGQLWEIRISDSRRRRMTRGFRDTAPRYSPDGTMIAFLRAMPGGKPQLQVIASAGGEPIALTDQPLGIGDFAFSPDSRRVVFEARVPEEGRYGTVDGVSGGLEDPRLVTINKYRMNGLGYTADKRQQLFLVEVPDLDCEPFIEPVGRAKAARDQARSASGRPGRSGDTVAHPAGPGGTDVSGTDGPGYGGPNTAVPSPRQLTSADADHLMPRFTADGARVLFTAALADDADTTLVTDVYSIAPDGTDRQKLSNLDDSRLSCGAAGESRDGAWLYYLATDVSSSGLDFVARNTALYVAPTTDPADVRRLTDPESTDLSTTESGVVPHSDSSVLVLNQARGTVELLEVFPDARSHLLADGPLVVTGVDSAAGIAVASYTDAVTMGDVGLVHHQALVTLTDFSAPLRDSAAVFAPLEESFPAPDGTAVHGWVVLPEGEGPHPVLLTIHGGPFAQYGWGYFDEAQVYARAGYAVLLCNPRGSAGYGQAHGRAVKEAMGTVDLQDVQAFLDGALEKYLSMDKERLGIQGGSYGGYLTAWAIAHDHRFTAAIVERGYLDPPSFVGSSDIGWFFSEEYTGSDPERVEAQNPFARIARVRTPTLVIHSEEDLRCPIEQAQRYYTALKKQGVPTELLIFPGETHELSRSGSPWHRRQRFEHILRWWAAWLPSKVNRPSLHSDASGNASPAGQ